MAKELLEDLIDTLVNEGYERDEALEIATIVDELLNDYEKAQA